MKEAWTVWADESEGRHYEPCLPLSMGSRPPHPLDLSYWTLEANPQFDETYYLEDVKKWVKANWPWKLPVPEDVSKNERTIS